MLCLVAWLQPSGSSMGSVCPTPGFSSFLVGQTVGSTAITPQAHVLFGRLAAKCTVLTKSGSGYRRRLPHEEVTFTAVKCGDQIVLRVSRTAANWSRDLIERPCTCARGSFCQAC
jgi:hypothetical protein